MKRINPIEEAFNIEPSTMLGSGTYDATYVAEPIVQTEIVQAEPVDQTIPPPKDCEDQEIFSKLEDIHSKAITAFQNQTEMVEIVDPKFAARNAEVAALYLTAALNAVNMMSRVKDGREKRRDTAKGPTTVNNNLVLTDRNSVMKMILAGLPGAAPIEEEKK